MSSRTLPSWFPWLLFLVPLLPLGHILVSGAAIGPWGAIGSMVPGLAKGEVGPWNILYADGALQFFEWRDLVFRAWGSGQMPFWNPYQLCGTPLLANSQSAALYPPHILLGVLHVPTALAMTLLAWFHLGLVGSGVCQLTRRLGGSDLGGLLAGVLTILSPFFLAWTALPSVIATCAWIPWIWYSLFNKKPLNRLLYSGAAIAMMILGGHLQLAFYGVLSVVLVVSAQAALDYRQSFRPVLGGVGALLLGGLIAAPQLVPALKFSQFSHRKTVPTAEGYAGYARSGIKPYEFVGLATPTLLGQSTGIDLQKSESGLDRMTGYWPASVKPGGNYAESALWLGPAILLLLASLRVSKHDPGRVGIGLVGTVGLLLALGTVVNWILYMYVPGWSATGSPGRASVLFVLASAVLAGLAFSQPPAKTQRLTMIPPAILGGVALASILLINTWGHSLVPWFPVALESSVAEAMVDGLPWAVGGVGLAITAWFVHRGGYPEWAATLFVVGHVVCVGLGQIPSGPTPAVLAPQDPSHRTAFVNSGWDMTKPYPALMPPNTAIIKGMYDVAGYDSLLHRDTVEMLGYIDGEDAAPPVNGNMMFIKRRFRPAALADAGVTEVWSRMPLPQLGLPATVNQADGYAVYPLSGAGRVYVKSPDGSITTAKFVEDRMDGQVVEASGPGTLVIRDRMMPGWTASLDGLAVPIEPGLWRLIELPAGPHRIALGYSPPGYVPFWLGLLGLIGAVGVPLALDRRKSGVATPLPQA